MPKVVDHLQRRQIIAEATWRIIEREGFHAATVRAIASEIGYTTGVVSHYFRDKERLMAFAFKQGCESAFRRIERESAHVPPGLPRLRIALERMMPDYLGIDVSAKATLNYWGAAAVNRLMIDVHRENYAAWRTFLTRFLSEALRLGQVDTDIAVGDETCLLIALVDGMLIGAVLEPNLYTRSTQHRLVTDALTRLARPGKQAIN